MNKIVIPLILVIFLAGVMFIFMIPKRPAKPTKTTPVKITPAETKLSEDSHLTKMSKKVSAVIESGDYVAAMKELSTYKKYDKSPEFMALEGLIYAGMKNFQMARLSFENSLKLKNDPVILYSLARILDTTGDIENANRLYYELAKIPLPPTTMKNVRMGCANTDLQLGKTENAEKIFLKVLSEHADCLEAYLGLFSTMQITGNVRKLSEIRIDGDINFSRNFEYVFNLGKLYYNSGNMLEAKQCFSDAASINPENSTPYYYLYRILRQSKQIPEAVKEMEKFHARNSILPYILFQAAIDARNEKKMSTAMKFYSSSTLRDLSLLGKDDEGTFKDIEKFVSTSGSAEEKAYFEVFNLFVNGDVEGAKKSLITAKNIINAANFKEDLDKIEYELYKKTAKEEQYNSYQSEQKKIQENALGRLKAMILARKAVAGDIGKTDKLDELKTKALNNPNDDKLQYETALELAKAGDREGAKIFFRQAIVANPASYEPYYSLGKIAKSEGNIVEAISHLEQAVKTTPQSSQAHSYLASLLLENGYSDIAVSTAEKALSVNPGNSEARVVIARMHFQKGDKEQALKQVNLALKFDTDPERKAELENLKKQFSAK
ncbi:MAG: tetratricopeptide repeat protein [Candidatus Riflebacteria bacterium]|nr:tetratricopeptide repeat protein [Candidatus Riflebacteria bacterium]